MFLIKKCNNNKTLLFKKCLTKISVCSKNFHEENENINKNVTETINNEIDKNVKNIIINDSNNILYVGANDELEIPPAPTNCCMSGCANCVWIEYAEKLMKLFQNGGQNVRKIILEQVDDANMRAFLEMELRNLENAKK